MLDAEITIKNIDYETTLCNIFPLLSEKISSSDSKNLIVRLLRQLGDAAVPVLSNVLDRLPEDTKDELLISAVNAYAPDLKDKVNRELRKDKWGQFFEIGTICVVKRADITLEISQIRVDYHELLKDEKVSSKVEDKLGVLSRPVKSIVNMAAFIAPDTIEKMGLDILLKNENKARLMELLRGVLIKYGIMIEVDELRIDQADEKCEDAVEVRSRFVPTEKAENDIISALAGYLRDSVCENGKERQCEA